MSRYNRPRKEDNFDKTAEIARSAYHTVMEIKDLMNLETKSYIYGQTAAAPNPTPQAGGLNWSGTILGTNLGHTLEQGDDDFQRIGDSIKIQHAHIRLRLTKNQAADDTHARIIVFWDEGNQVDVVEKMLINGFKGTSAAVLSFKEWDLRFDTKIIAEKFVHMPADSYNTTALFGESVALVDFSLPINKHTQYLSGTTTIVTGALKCMVITDNTNNISCVWSSQLLYTDD